MIVDTQGMQPSTSKQHQSRRLAGASKQTCFISFFIQAMGERQYLVAELVSDMKTAI
jgi:hypothetical protein